MADMVRNDNFICIQGWMINDLQLKGNELIVYAIIYGFSQVENQVFSGSLQYLAEWTNSTKQGVLKNLKSLQDKGFIGKNEKFINGVKFCEYYATKFNGVLNKVEQGIKQSLMGGIKQSLTNNIDINNIDNNIEDNKVSKKVSFDSLISRYTDNEELRQELKNHLATRKSKKATLTNRAIELSFKKLDELVKKVPINEQEQVKIKIVQQSIERGWTGFFELKEQGSKQYNNKNTNWFDVIGKEEGIF